MPFQTPPNQTDGVFRNAGPDLSLHIKGTLQVELPERRPIRDIYDRWINKYANHSVDVLTELSRDLKSK